MAEGRGVKYVALGDSYASGVGLAPGLAYPVLLRERGQERFSGLTQAAYGSVGIYIGAHLVSSQYYTMANQGRLVYYGNMIPGDLLYYADGGNPDWGFYHVAMYVGGGQMIEAPREGVPVRVTSVRYYDLVPYVGRPS